MIGDRHNSNTELIAQVRAVPYAAFGSMASNASPVFSSLPSTGCPLPPPPPHQHTLTHCPQGVANIASAAFGGLPATGALARTAANIRSGGRTPIAGMVHAATILAVMVVRGGGVAD